MIEYVLNAPISILLRAVLTKYTHPKMLCDMCLREGRCVPATHIFPIKTTRYYFVCDKHYAFLNFTGGRTEEKYYERKDG